MSSVLSRILTVVPVYNHVSTLRDVVVGAVAAGGEVLVVDDGSSEDVRGALEGLDVHLASHATNEGKGAAILTAVGEAKRLGKSHIITIDADGQHDPADIGRFVEMIEKHPLGIVIGKRDFPASAAPFSSRFGRGFSNFWFRLQTGHSAGDAQSGFRAYPVDVIERLKLREKGYAFEVEVLVRASWAGVKLRVVDVSVHYPPPDERISHFHLLKDNVRLSLLNTRLTMRAIVPYPHGSIIPDDSTAAKVSILSPWKSVGILMSHSGSPARLAASGGLGIFLGALPLIGIHTVTILLAASFLRLNRLAALSASQLCMPPFVPALCIETGYFMRNGRFLTDISLQTLGYEGLDRLFEWVIGSLVLGPALALVVSAVIYIMAVCVKKGTCPANG